MWVTKREHRGLLRRSEELWRLQNSMRDLINKFSREVPTDTMSYRQAEERLTNAYFDLASGVLRNQSLYGRK